MEFEEAVGDLIHLHLRCQCVNALRRRRGRCGWGGSALHLRRDLTHPPLHPTHGEEAGRAVRGERLCRWPAGQRRALGSATPTARRARLRWCPNMRRASAAWPCPRQRWHIRRTLDLFSCLRILHSPPPSCSCTQCACRNA